MSDQIKHECGIALVRLLKPLEYFHEKYGSSLYGIQKLHLLMQKMRNRGQDGAGVATIKLNVDPGSRYISRKRSKSAQHLKDLFSGIYSHFKGLSPEELADAAYLKTNKPYTGELLLGHLRYGTHGSNTIETVHPFLRQSNWISRNLILAGNFNLTNVDELFEELVELGQYPKEKSDTVTILEKIGHFLDDEINRLHTWYKPDNYSSKEINELIFDNLDLQRLLKRACRKFDGGYVMAGLIGHGDAFVLRDPNGIRPCSYYMDDEVVVVASERPAIQTAFDVHSSNIHELDPGHALIIKRNGSIKVAPYADKIGPKKSCSFERIYFSRGTDKDIYQERKKLGENVVDQIVKSIDGDFDNTLFSFIPNTAESAFLGMVKGLEEKHNLIKAKKLLKLENQKPKKIKKILDERIRVEKLTIKDAKLRTFITDGKHRNDLVSHVYDVTYGLVKNNVDTLVLIDDSIVRGTTLKNSIISILSRLRPKKIIIASSAPQIRYPDCYGIDMSRMGEFIAFRAMIELIKEKGKEKLLKKVYKACKVEMTRPKKKIRNQVKRLYDEFGTKAITKKIAHLVTPSHIKCKVEVIYQTIEGLHDACPGHTGDWYFTGEYPTPGGNIVVNQSFINFMEDNEARPY